MRAGRLRKWVQVQESTVTIDAAGGAVDTWAKVWDRRAAIEPINGREMVESDQVRTVATVKILMRWWDGLKATHRIKYGSRIFEINHIINRNERNREYELLCTEVISDA